jgi:hypothetical protein
VVNLLACSTCRNPRCTAGVGLEGFQKVNDVQENQKDVANVCMYQDYTIDFFLGLYTEKSPRLVHIDEHQNQPISSIRI